MVCVRPSGNSAGVSHVATPSQPCFPVFHVDITRLSPPSTSPPIKRSASMPSAGISPPAPTLPVAPAASTAGLVSQLQSELQDIIAQAQMSTPELCSRLSTVSNLVVEVVTRWRRSTALALSNIKSYEDIISQKNTEVEALTQQLRERVCACVLSSA